MATRKKQPRRLGRPPSAESSDTRTRITETARLLFSERGFEVTTNKMLAAKAGITTGALYHYFDSKYAIYAAVYDEVQTIVYGHFGVVEAENHTFITRFEAMLEVAYDLNRLICGGQHSSSYGLIGNAFLSFGKAIQGPACFPIQRSAIRRFGT